MVFFAGAALGYLTTKNLTVGWICSVIGLLGMVYIAAKSHTKRDSRAKSKIPGTDEYFLKIKSELVAVLDN